MPSTAAMPKEHPFVLAPKAWLATCKVLFLNNAVSSDSGVDQAAVNGVHLLSLSLGVTETPFNDNPIVLGAFSVMEKGFFVSWSSESRAFMLMQSSMEGKP